VRNFTADDSAWADFLISKAALILASIVLFAALFGLVADFKDFEIQKQLDYLAWDFKNTVDKVGAMSFQEEISMKPSDESFDESSDESFDESSDESSDGSSNEFSDESLDESSNESSDDSSDEYKKISYCFSEKEVFRTLPFGKDLKIHISGEYVSLGAEFDGRSFSAVKPFAFRILPFNESALQEKLHTRFGTDGTMASPLTDDCVDIEAFIRMLGTEEVVMDPEKNVSLKKELIYIKDEEGVSALAYILIYQ
jgi:hypothetical protein